MFVNICFQPELLKAVVKKLEAINFITDTLSHGDSKYMVSYMSKYSNYMVSYMLQNSSIAFSYQGSEI